MGEATTVKAFSGDRRIAGGEQPRMPGEVKSRMAGHREAGLLYFDDKTGLQLDFSLREKAHAPRAERPKLGVGARH